MLLASQRGSWLLGAPHSQRGEDAVLRTEGIIASGLEGAIANHHLVQPPALSQDQPLPKYLSNLLLKISNVGDPAAFLDNLVQCTTILIDSQVA